MTDHLYYNGRYYGYPECCIEVFAETFGKHPRSRERDIASQIVGYIPCSSCADKILDGTFRVEDLVSEVNSRRRCPKPYIKMKEKTIEEMEEDYKAYVKRREFKSIIAAMEEKYKACVERRK